MKFLTLHQPWASLVAIGAKRIETRSWPTSYRGRLGICAAAAFPQRARTLCWQPDFAAALIHGGYGDIRQLPLGKVLAVVDLVHCVPVSAVMLLTIGDDQPFGDFTFGQYAWMLENVGRLRRPIPCKGTHRLWSEPDLARLVCSSMGESFRKADG